MGWDEVEYRKGSHTVYNIEYHVVWVTKYRYHVLTGEVAQRVRELIRQSCLSRGINIIRGNVGKAHIHLLISCPPHLAPAKIVQYLKGRSSRLMLQEFPHLSKRYWGQHLWGRGYFCAAVGAVTEEMIKEYIENQETEAPEEAFKVDSE